MNLYRLINGKWTKQDKLESLEYNPLKQYIKLYDKSGDSMVCIGLGEV